MKKFLSLVVAALLSVSAVATTASAAFTDVDAKNEALTDAVELLTALNVTKGTSETTFGTDENVTRQQMAAFIYRMMKAGKSYEGKATDPNTTSFADLKDPTFFFMVSWANSQGIIKGRSATSFDPDGGIILQDAYTMIVRALGYDDGTLSYPIGFISKAEELGLDKDLPSTVDYTTELSRGEVAIILANMFYAETADVEIKYEASWEEVQLSDGTYAVVSKGQVPKEYHKTVAEAIFEVEKVSQRVVATTNYSFEGYDKNDEDVEMITLSKDYVTDYEDYETDIPSLEVREFDELGLPGTADDYFLSDIVMFVKEVDGEYEIFGATATGTKTTVSFDDVTFGTVSGTNSNKYYDGAAKEYKMINGKLTLGDTVTYLFDAPYSFTKDQEANKYNAQFITLDEYDGDMESDDEKDHIKFNYVIDLDVEYDDSIIGTYVTDGDLAMAVDVDETEGRWIYDGYLSQVYFNGLGEIDVYDCDGNGKPEYLFVKNYTVGTIDDEEDGLLDDTDVETDAENLIIYTDLAIVEGVEFEDEDIVLAYVNTDANYVKVAEVLAPVEATIATSATKYFTLSTDNKVYYKDLTAVVANGALNLANVTPEAADAENAFEREATYYFSANGTLVYETGLDAAINLNEDYAIVLSKDTTKSTTMVNGKLESADYIDLFFGGEVKSVKAKKITESSTQYDADITPETYFIDDDGEYYDYTAYVNKLATAKSDKKGAHYFKLVDFSENTDITVLQDKEDGAEYRATDVTTQFYNKSGKLFYLEDAAEAEGSKIRQVYAKEYTQIIIRSRDEDGEWVVNAYDYDNLPDIKEETEFVEVSYILVNNVNSSSYENLAVFYGVLDEELEGDPGEVADVRIVKSYTKSSSEDGTVYTYDVFNPFTGKVDTGIEGAETDNAVIFAKGDIVGLTTLGLIDNSVDAAGYVYDEGDYYDVDDKFEDLTTLGYSTVVEYDETTGFLEINESSAIFEITADTVVTFSDRSEETIKVVDASVLASTAKTYREGEDKANDLRVFLCVEVDEDADDDEEFYIVNFAMIVRN